jgi:hypothetical protein
MQWNQGNREILFTKVVKGIKTEGEVKIWNSGTQERMQARERCLHHPL